MIWYLVSPFLSPLWGWAVNEQIHHNSVVHCSLAPLPKWTNHPAPLGVDGAHVHKSTNGLQRLCMTNSKSKLIQKPNILWWVQHIDWFSKNNPVSPSLLTTSFHYNWCFGACVNGKCFWWADGASSDFCIKEWKVWSNLMGMKSHLLTIGSSSQNEQPHSTNIVFQVWTKEKQNK